MDASYLSFLRTKDFRCVFRYYYGVNANTVIVVLTGHTLLLFAFRVRELTTAKIGTLLRITGQVVRTHPVHPELVSGTFMCLECRTIIKDVEQQFKYTQVGPTFTFYLRTLVKSV